jgi:uncharacterized membrane protein
MHMATGGQNDSREGLRAALRWILAAFYLAAGIAHLMVPAGFLPIVPGWVPWPRETVLATGICEIAGSFGLKLRRVAGSLGP